MIRDVNLGLFILIVGTLIAFAGFTVYYQKTFTNLSLDYNTKLGELQKVSSTLQTEKARLNLTSYQLKIKAERESDLSQKYESMREQKEKLDKEKVELESELSNTKSNLQQKVIELSAKADELNQKIVELKSANTQIDTLNAQISTLKDDIKSKEGKIDTLCNQLKDLGQSC